MPNPNPTPARLILSLALAGAAFAATPIQITIDTTAPNRVAISPYIYGKNNCLTSTFAQQDLSAAEWTVLRDSGLKLVRDHGGNNSTKYNWRKKLSSHPDWYNNVYARDWDDMQTKLQNNLPGVQGMWAFQLLGKVADNTTNNFNDWAYNGSAWWSGVGQNLAGGGTVNPAGGGTALKEGDPTKYLANTSAAESTALLDHWISPAGLGLDRTRFRYWNMDNEPDIWDGTHDDVMKTKLTGEEFMQIYFAYAKAARARYPDIKLLGPVPANEWQWYNWTREIVVDGKKYPWLEYFIKRVAEEQARTGIRLLDVLDIHFYPSSTNAAQVLQYHRVFFDRNYVYPEANGVRTVNGGWDTSINKEYIFGRCSDWLVQYMGEQHGVTFGLTEAGLETKDPTLNALWYASTLGEFMRNGVEIFAPWTWREGMWEVLHLYSRYNYGTSVKAVSTDETMVSAYPTLDPLSGNLTVVLVNRDTAEARSVTVDLPAGAIPDGSYQTLRLVNLPATETFVSHTQNALAPGTVSVAANRLTLSLPSLSITSVLLRPNADVTPPATSSSRLINLSVRAKGGTGAEKLIVGFVTRGTGSKQILLRAIGPTLTDFKVPGVMADPQIILYRENQETPLATNQDWADGGATALAETFASSGAFALKTTSLDAALVAGLTQGQYTFHVTDRGNGSGIALGELYDAEPASTARLVNVSARVAAGTGSEIIAAGFAISGGSSKRVLVRAVGPGLTQFKVPGVLADPVLKLYRQGETMPIYHCDNWSDLSYASEVVTVSADSGAFGLPAGSKDAVLLVTLPPGVYSAVASGLNDTTGVCLVEVYEAE